MRAGRASAGGQGLWGPYFLGNLEKIAWSGFASCTVLVNAQLRVQEAQAPLCSPSPSLFPLPPLSVLSLPLPLSLSLFASELCWVAVWMTPGLSVGWQETTGPGPPIAMTHTCPTPKQSHHPDQQLIANLWPYVVEPSPTANLQTPELNNYLLF